MRRPRRRLPPGSGRRRGCCGRGHAELDLARGWAARRAGGAGFGFRRGDGAAGLSETGRSRPSASWCAPRRRSRAPLALLPGAQSSPIARDSRRRKPKQCCAQASLSLMTSAGSIMSNLSLKRGAASAAAFIRRCGRITSIAAVGERCNNADHHHQKKDFYGFHRSSSPVVPANSRPWVCKERSNG